MIYDIDNYTVKEARVRTKTWFVGTYSIKKTGRQCNRVEVVSGSENVKRAVHIVS